MQASVVLGFSALLLGGGSALPSIKVPKWAYNTSLTQADCKSKLCAPPSMNYSKVLPVTPRIQWEDDGGYCGSMSIQEIALGQGVWLSQQQVRQHTVPGGGHDEEILETNIQLALDNLHLLWDAFQYKSLPTPQADSYRTWIKQHIIQGHGVVWMIMLAGGRYPVYAPLSPYGFYSHVEPVFGVYSNHPLTDPTFYEDDYIVKFPSLARIKPCSTVILLVVSPGTQTDADPFVYYRRFDSLVAGVSSQNVSQCPQGDYLGYPCIYNVWGFGWAITGVKDTRTTGLRISLAMDSSQEPDVIRGAKPSQMTGTVTVEGLTTGSNYEMWRWDSVESAFDYTNATKTVPFTPTNATFVWTDPMKITSNTAVYFRCHPA